MIVYAHTRSPRLEYVIDFLSHYYGHNFLLTTDVASFHASTEGRINYSEKKISDRELIIHPVGLLESRDIQVLDHGISQVGGVPALFSNKSDTGFDILSAIFYLISRYEEYLPHTKDVYGRYAHQNAVAFREGFLEIPVVNHWLFNLIAKIRTFTDVVLPRPPFRYLPTYDIDIAWSFKRKGFVRNAGGLFRSLLKANWPEAKQRLTVLTGSQTDPYDSYEWMDAVHRKHRLRALYFFHVGEKRNRYDKNIPPHDAEMQELIHITANKHDVGIHPSWNSGDDPAVLKQEIHSLEKITGKPITQSRQHYIRFTLPDTYQLLIENGIKEDFSMGYGTVNGFRASIGTPFFWYDLKKEQKTDLLVHPFCYMDANSFYEQRNSPAEALKELKNFHGQLTHTGGTMITIFHNNFLGEGREFAGWKQIYEDFLSATA